MAAKPPNEFYDTDRLTAWLTNLLYMGLLITAVSMVSTFFELRLLDDFEQGRFDTEDAANTAAHANDSRQLAIATLNIAWLVVAGTLSLVWIFRSAHNAGVHARQMEYTPASCVWWYFVPFANLWKPYGAMKEIWTESATQAGEPNNSGSGLLGGWWAAWIALGITGNAVFRMSMRADEIDELQMVDNFSLIVDVVDLIATALFLLIVLRLSALQERVRDNPPAPQSETPGGNW